jgi:hypothetical protein
MFWTILSAISFAWFFYSLGRKRGFEEGIEYHSRRAEEMLKREELKSIWDGDNPAPSRGFGKRRLTRVK